MIGSKQLKGKKQSQEIKLIPHGNILARVETFSNNDYNGDDDVDVI